MSNQALTLFDGPQMAVPAHLAAFFETDGNIGEKQTVPSLSYGGKAWTISKNGEKTKMTRRNDDGDEEVIQTIKVIVLDYAKDRGRAYYEGAYNPDTPGRPICWSDGGNVPSADVPEPQSPSCKTCPMAAKGSKITEQGRAVTACSTHRMIAVVPASQPGSTPLRCKLAITSLFDKQSPDLEKAGWTAFEQYIDLLRSRGVSHTAAVVTKMKFDPNTDYPKIIFSPDRWLDPAELAIAAPASKSPEVKALLDGSFTPNGADGTAAEPFEQGDPPAAEAAKPAAAKPRATRAAPLPAAKPEPAPIAEAVKPEPVAAVVTADVPADVAALLADWAE